MTLDPMALAAVPNPGSLEAVAKGCTCPVIDNHYGEGAWGRGTEGIFWYTSGCPVHWPIGTDHGPFAAVAAPLNEEVKPE